MPDFRDAILHDCVGFGDLCGDFSRSQIRGDLAFDVAGLQLGIVGVDQPLMTGPPRKLTIAIHMLRRFPERTQTGNDGHNRNAQQDATGGLCIPYRRADLIL
jgi:hypothetical protein